MAVKPISTPLPADLPETWQTGQTVAPTGAEVGLSEQHGYNYLMEQVNAAQEALNTINNAFDDLATTEDVGDITPEGIGAIPSSEKGQANGVATLGSDGKVPAGQLPEMDYDPSGTAQSAVNTHNTSSTAHQDIRTALAASLTSTAVVSYT